MIAAKLMHTYKSHGATDVSGYGPVGELQKIAEASKNDVDLVIHTLPIIKEAIKVNEVCGVYLLPMHHAHASQTRTHSTSALASQHTALTRRPKAWLVKHTTHTHTTLTCGTPLLCLVLPRYGFYGRPVRLIVHFAACFPPVSMFDVTGFENHIQGAFFRHFLHCAFSGGYA